jgi:hypothetical protein
MILVFKTTVSDGYIEKIAAFLKGIKSVSKWNFDFDDCDNILRIETKINVSNRVINGLKLLNFDCEELK